MGKRLLVFLVCALLLVSSFPLTAHAEAFPVMGDNLKYDPNVKVNNGDPVTVKIWVPAAWESYYRKWTEAYNAFHPNVSFDWTITSFEDHWKKVPVALNSGSGPDLFWMHNSKNEVMLMNMEPLSEEMFPMEQLKQDFRQVESNVVDGKLYYTDLGLMTGVIFYNTQIWADAGLTEADIPKTWDQMREVAKKLTEYDEAGNIKVAGFNMNDAEYLWVDLMYQQGKWLFDESGEVAKFQSPEGLKAAQLMYDLYNTDKSGSGTQPKGFEAFPNGKAAMIYCWGWATNLFKSSFPDFEYSAFALPVFDTENIPAYGRTNGDVSLGVSNKAEAAAKEAALNFVLYQLCNDDMLVEYDVFDGMAPTKYSLDSRPEIQGEPVLAVETALVDRTPWPGAAPDNYFAGVQKYIGQSMLVNGTSPEQALAEAEELVNAEMMGLGFKSVERKYKYASEFSDQ